MKELTSEELENALAKAQLEGRLAGVLFFDNTQIQSRHFIPELLAVQAQFPHMDFYRIDGIENPSVSKRYEVAYTPSLLLIRNLDEIARLEGPYERNKLRQRLSDLVKKL
jgi:hypothetical protein